MLIKWLYVTSWYSQVFTATSKPFHNLSFSKIRQFFLHLVFKEMKFIITCSNFWKCQNRMSFIMNFRFRCILFKTFWNFPYMWFRISGCAGDVIWLRISRGVKAAILVTSIWDSFWVIWKISLNHKHQGS